MIEIKLTTTEGANAQGVFYPEANPNKQITIKKGSVLTIDPYAQGIATNIQQNYTTAANAIEANVLRKIGDGKYEVLKDFADLSVSGSSVIVTGKAGSGWKKWTLEDGRLLDVLRHTRQ